MRSQLTERGKGGPKWIEVKHVVRRWRDDRGRETSEGAEWRDRGREGEGGVGGRAKKNSF